MTTPVSLFRWDELPLQAVTELIARKAVPAGDDWLSQVYLKKGALVPMHAHPVPQLIYVLEGALRVDVNGESVTVRDGSVLQLAAGTPHQLEALDDTFVLDVRGLAALTRTRNR